MKKHSLFTLLLCFTAIAVHSQAQDSGSKINGDTLVTTMGFKIIKGNDLKIGVGTMPDGDFKYIRTNSASLLNYTSSTGYQGLANQANALPRSSSGQTMKVIRVESRGNKKRGFVNYVVLGGFKRFEVDVDNAITTGELVVPNEFKPKVAGAIATISSADELKKYKELLDSGAITQAEYDAKKKQILGL
jgi:hypothetical protein